MLKEDTSTQQSPSRNSTPNYKQCGCLQVKDIGRLCFISYIINHMGLMKISIPLKNRKNMNNLKEILKFSKLIIHFWHSWLYMWYDYYAPDINPII